MSLQGNRRKAFGKAVFSAATVKSGISLEKIMILWHIEEVFTYKCGKR